MATCSDDNIVCVLQKGSALSYIPLGKTEANHESWDALRLWRGHTMDVLHVAWSPDGARLASCGVDNSVMVWQLSESAGAPRRLSHEGFVKGVEWDPVGKYLAAQVDGGEIKATVVWRVRDWQVRTRPRAPAGSTS